MADQGELDKVHVNEGLEQYLRDVLEATRSPQEWGLGDLVGKIELGADPRDFGRIMDEAREIHSQGVQARMGEDPNYNGLAGRSVCFTGTLQSSICGERVTKSMAEESAEAAGMVVHKTVTKSLDYLVVADPETMSGKAKKARKLGVRILAEPVFWQRLGISVE